MAVPKTASTFLVNYFLLFIISLLIDISLGKSKNNPPIWYDSGTLAVKN